MNRHFVVGLSSFIGTWLIIQGVVKAGDCAVEHNHGSCCPALMSYACWGGGFCSPNIIRSDDWYSVTLDGATGYDPDTPTDATPATCEYEIYKCNEFPMPGCHFHAYGFSLHESRRIIPEGARCP